MKTRPTIQHTYHLYHTGEALKHSCLTFTTPAPPCLPDLLPPFYCPPLLLQLPSPYLLLHGLAELSALDGTVTQGQRTREAVLNMHHPAIQHQQA